MLRGFRGPSGNVQKRLLKNGLGEDVGDGIAAALVGVVDAEDDGDGEGDPGMIEAEIDDDADADGGIGEAESDAASDAVAVEVAVCVNGGELDGVDDGVGGDEGGGGACETDGTT